jgi:hypothetical protein
VEVAIASRASSASQQVNFTLDPHWRLVLRVVAEAEGVSVPDLLRPVVMRYLRRRMKEEDLREAVSRIESHRKARSGVPNNITRLSGANRATGSRFKGRGQVKGDDSEGRRR